MHPEVEHRGDVQKGGRRWYDSLWYRRGRDGWMLIITIVTLFALYHAHDAVRQVQNGRRVGQGITCAVLSSISETGKQVIEGSSLSETPFTRFLERHGYPPPKVREREARKKGRAYVRNISRSVERLVGHRGDGLIRKDGTIDCRRLSVVSAIPPLR